VVGVGCWELGAFKEDSKVILEFGIGKDYQSGRSGV
jgi:hypothetical protein